MKCQVVGCPLLFMVLAKLVPGFEVFNAVSSGSIEMGHAGAYYWKGKIPAAPIFSAIPFGMNVNEMNAWLHYGGGLEIMARAISTIWRYPFCWRKHGRADGRLV